MLNQKNLYQFEIETNNGHSTIAIQKNGGHQQHYFLYLTCTKINKRIINKIISKM